MRVSFVNPAVTPFRKIMRNFDCATESKGNYLYQPYDFLLLSSRIPPTWKLQFIDAVANRFAEEKVLKELNAYGPQIIVCALAATNWDQDFNFLCELREKFPDAYLLVFGDLFIEKGPAEKVSPFVNGILSSPVIFHFEVLENLHPSQFRSSDYDGFRSDEFYSRSDLKSPQQISLSHVRHSYFLHPSYRWPFSRFFTYTTIFTAWGCPYSCSYCIMSKFPNYWRDHEEIIEEMIEVKKTGIKEIYIGDRSFGLPLMNVMKLLQSMIDHKFNFSWSTYFHPNQYTPELLIKMKESGCHTIIVGIENSDQATLKAYGRHIRQNQFEALIKHARELKIDICGDFIIGLPHEDSSSVEATIKYSKRLGIDFASFNIAAPLAGSSIREIAIAEGKMKSDEEHFDSLGRNKVLSVSKIKPEEIVSLRNQAVFKFYARPTYLFNRLVKIKNLQHLIIQSQEAIQIFAKIFK